MTISGKAAPKMMLQITLAAAVPKVAINQAGGSGTKKKKITAGTQQRTHSISLQ